jgi:DNA-binding transcriptional ArsR family regulator
VTERDDERLWAAVAEPGRRRVLDALVVCPETTPTALARELPFTRQAVSKHLAVLLDAGLVTQRRAGREVLYAIQPERLGDAARAMNATAARWDVRLTRIKRIAEAAYLREQHGEPPE